MCSMGCIPKSIHTMASHFALPPFSSAITVMGASAVSGHGRRERTMGVCPQPFSPLLGNDGFTRARRGHRKLHTQSSKTNIPGAAGEVKDAAKIDGKVEKVSSPVRPESVGRTEPFLDIHQRVVKFYVKLFYN